MNKYRSDTGQDIVYVDFSTSRMPEAVQETTATPESSLGAAHVPEIQKSRVVHLEHHPNTPDMPEIDRSNLTEAELEALLYHLATQSDEDDDKLILEYEDFFDAQLDASSQEPPLEEWERHLDEL